MTLANGLGRSDMSGHLRIQQLEELLGQRDVAELGWLRPEALRGRFGLRDRATIRLPDG